MAEKLAEGWARTREHLAAARSVAAARPGADLAMVREFLDHNELGLAFDSLVDVGAELNLPLEFWTHLDRAAQEMHLYSEALPLPYLTAADLCRRRIAAASEST